MKIKYIIGIYTIILMLIMLAFFHVFTDKETKYLDMVYYGEQLKLIENKLQLKENRKVIEHSYQCKILFLTDSNYKSILYERIQEEDIILDYYQNEQIVGKIAWNAEESLSQVRKRLLIKSELLCLIILLAGYFLIAFIYIYFIRPFRQLQVFSGEIAKGNLDLFLPMSKHNFFGAFTESFDIMREELKRAKESEYLANRSKKELVAELSHDIKTPVATIKATCEVCKMKEKNPDTLEKISIIAGKADMIDNLIENLFHCTLEELEVLKVEMTEESSVCITQMLQELKYYGEIIFKNTIPEFLVYMDKIRLQQVIDNIVNNAYKYAGTAIYISFVELNDGIQVVIRDTGNGVPEEELVLITEKFYRGSNTSGKSGSGLGLYLSQIFMEQMQGGIECYNHDGFVVSLFIKKVTI